MLPSFKNGDFVLAKKSCNYQIGDVIIYETKEFGLVIKRLASIENNTVFLTADNSRLESSICNIPLSIDGVIGKVILKSNLLVLSSIFSNKNK
tara:strand:+ start:819 stop:1097 length:279 start_codon:yes stop_codon:yes gene_type:complete